MRVSLVRRFRGASSKSSIPPKTPDGTVRRGRHSTRDASMALITRMGGTGCLPSWQAAGRCGRDRQRGARRLRDRRLCDSGRHDDHHQPRVSHRDPRYFERPTEFRPERWGGDFARQLPRFAYMPFGGGPRICIGNRFAMMEAVLILATVAQRFRLQWHGTRPAVPLPSITLRPKGGIWVKLAPRAQ